MEIAQNREKDRGEKMIYQVAEIISNIISLTLTLGVAALIWVMVIFGVMMIIAVLNRTVKEKIQ